MTKHSFLCTATASGENFPLLLTRHLLGQSLTIPGLQRAPQGGAAGFFTHVDFSLTVDDTDNAGFSATQVLKAAP